MPRLVLPHLQNALEQLSQVFAKVEGAPVDLLKAPWADLEKTAAKVLGGPFNVQKPEHQAVAGGLAAAFGERLAEGDGGFWFPNRESPEGAMVGFPDAILMVSPMGAVMDCLGKAQLPRLDEIAADIRKALAQAKFGPNAGAQRKLDPAGYQRLFDPGFVQFVLLDPPKAKAAWDSTPPQLVNQIRDAMSRPGSQVPAELKPQIEQQILTGLSKLDPNTTLLAQSARAPRLVELVGHLFGSVQISGAAPEEFWAQVVFPLLFIGAPASFPPLDEDDLAPLGQGADAFSLYLDAVPYTASAPEDGLLGAFPRDGVGVPHPDLAKGTPHLLILKTEAIRPRIEAFDVAAAKAALEKFGAYVNEKAGKPVPANPDGEKMRDAAFQLLTDLKRMFATRGELGLRQLTEAEATSEGALRPVREALQGSRIIIAP
jgi:hypothetical protein